MIMHQSMIRSVHHEMDDYDNCDDRDDDGNGYDCEEVGGMIMIMTMMRTKSLMTMMKQS